MASRIEKGCLRLKLQLSQADPSDAARDCLDHVIRERRRVDYRITQLQSDRCGI